MIRDMTLSAPGETGVFDPFTNSVGLDFDLEDLYPDVTRPSPATWPKNWTLFHEWAHFYQFATTNYGFFYQALASSQLLLANGFLRMYTPRRRRYRLPLLAAQPVRSLADVMKSKDALNGGLHIRQLQWVDDYRTAIFGNQVKPGLQKAFSDDSQLMLALLNEMFGVPKTLVYWPPEGEMGQSRFRVGDFLESHAFALATLWIAQAVERFDLPKSIVPEAARYANTAAIGPYNAFLRYSEWLAAEPQWQLHLFCLLCDMSLNPPGPGLAPPGATDKSGQPTTFVMPDTTWSPVSRLWQLVTLANQGTMPASRAGTTDYLDQFPPALKQSLDLQGDYFPPFQRQQYDPRPMLHHLVRFNDVPQALELAIQERLLTFEIAQRARRITPYWLGGNVIEELTTLTQYLGGPAGICHLPGRKKAFFHICTGLMTEGVISKTDPANKASDEILWQSMPIIETLRLIMRKS